MNDKLFHDNLFVQMTPGEVSQDQATRNYFYNDPMLYVNDALAANFWSPAGEALEVGSLITVRGLLGKSGTAPAPAPYTYTQVTFQVWKKELNPPGHRDRYRIWVNIGSNTKYINSHVSSVDATNQTASDLTTQNMLCKYRGVIEYKPMSPLATPVSWNMNINASRFHIEASDFCRGQLITAGQNTNTLDSFIGMVVPHHGGDPESIGIYWNGGAGPVPVVLPSPPAPPGTYLSIWVWIEIFGLYYNV